MNYKGMIDLEAKSVCFDSLMDMDISQGIVFDDEAFLDYCYGAFDHDEILASENAAELDYDYENTEESGHLREMLQIFDTINTDMQERIDFYVEKYKNSLSRKLLGRAYEHLKGMTKLKWPPVNQARNLLKEVLHCPK